MKSILKNTRNILYFLCWIWIFPSCIYGQILFTHYKVEDGLPHDFTFKVYQDDRDYLWIGTDDGLAKFNGSTFKVFDRTDGFASDFIMDINKYKSDTLAIAVWKGGLHLMKGDSIIVPDIIKKKFDYGKIHSIYPIGKDILASRDKYHILYEWQKGITFKKHKLKIIKDKEKEITLSENIEKRDIALISTMKSVADNVYFYRGMRFHGKSSKLKGVYQYISKETIIPVFPFLKDKYINDIGSYGQDLFYATEIDSFFVYNKHRIISRKKYPFKNGTIHKYAQTSYCKVFGVKDDQSGNDIIYLYDKKKNIWKELSEKSKSGSGILLSYIFVDREENIWITSKADGLYKLSKDYSKIAEIIDSNSHIIDITVGKENVIFFLTLKSIYGFDYKSKNTQIKFFSGNAIGFYHNTESRNKIQIAHKSELDKSFSFLGNNFSTVDHNPETFLLEENNHRFLFNIRSFSYIDNNKISRNINIQDVNKNANISDIKKIKNEIWVATDFGIMVYDSQSLEYMKMISSENSNKRSYVKEIVQDANSKIWSVMSKKLVSIEDGGCIRYYNREDGIASDKINDIMIDHKGILWIATQKGFSIFKNKMFYNFNKKDGIRSSFVSKIIEDNNNKVWIGGNKGAIAFDNNNPFQPIVSPKIIIEKKQNHFDIDVIDYSGKEITVQYKTKTNDIWKDSHGKLLDISNFGVNEYQVQFRARNPLSNWSYSQEHHFVIVPVWYKRIPFIILMSIGVGLLTILMIYIRLQRVTERNQKLEWAIQQSNVLEKELSTVRENVARDFHDELGNKLAGISVLSELMLKNEKEEPTRHVNAILQVQKNAKDLYFGIKDFIWSIDTKSDLLEELIIYLSDFGEELFANTGIVFKIEKNLDQTSTRLPYYWSRQLLLMFKEILTNALRHSSASEVILVFNLNKNHLEIKSSDNGIGFDLDIIKRKNGLLNIEKRAEKLQGKIMIRCNQGTHISFFGKLF